MLTPPLHPQENERIAQLRRLGILDTASESDFDTLVALAAEIAQVPIALVSLVDEHRQWFKARHGLNASETPRDVAFCAHAILDPTQPFVIADALSDARFSDNPLVVGGPRVIFYAGVPLQAGAQSLPMGTLCVIDHQPRQLEAKALAQLQLLARHVEQLLELRLRQREVEERYLAIHREEQRVSTILSTMDSGLVVQRRDGAIVSCNPASQRILGLSADQMMGRTSMDPRWHATRSDGSPFPGDEHPAMRALATGQAQRDVVMGVGTEGGDRRWILINAQPIDRDAQQQPQAVISSFIDITSQRREESERRRAEQQVERYFTMSLELLCIASHDGRFLRVSQAWTSVLGWSSGDLVGQPFVDFLHPEDRDSTIAAAAELGKGGSLRNFINRYRCRDGSYRTLRWTAVADVDALMAVARDITDDLRYQADLVRAKDAAESAVRAKSEFLATMSHEIRTPMNGVIGLTDALLGTTLSNDQRDMLSSIRDSGRSLLAILNDILDWSRIEAGRLTLELAAVDPEAIVRDVVTVLTAQATAKGLHVRAGSIASAAIQGDAGRIRQILFNLLGNAIKFTERGSVSIEFALHNGMGRFTISDTGIGIPAHRLSGLFQRFTQVDASTTRRFGGSGLGLAISKQLATLMNGDVFATSVEGQGSTFIVDLPLSAAGVAQPNARSTQNFIPLKPSRSLRLLLAEDNPVNQRVALALLGQFGHRCQVTINGRDAVTAFQQGGWDAVLMDVQMPEMDGKEATRAIRQIECAACSPRVPIIALTASAMPEERAACIAAGMDDVLSKPITKDSLRRMLAQWCA